MTPFDLKADRDARIQELEAQRAPRPSMGIKWPLALLGMATAGFLLWQMRLEVAYFFAPATPVALGSEGNYRLEGLRSNLWVVVHGTPTLRGAYFQEEGKTRVVVGLQDTPLLVRREALEGEAYEVGKTPPQPNQSPFSVRGRLLSRADAPRYAAGFDTLSSMGEVKPEWIILQGESPRGSVRTFLWTGGLWVFFVLNLWFLYRDLAARLSR